MRLSLHITKNYPEKTYNNPSHIDIAVVDLDISNIFPTNFVCLLPKRLLVSFQNQSDFQKKFGEKSQEILKDLLENALESTDDSDFTRELRSRLKLINQKPKNLVNCCVCGKGFMARMIELCLQETCIGCKNKKM